MKLKIFSMFLICFVVVGACAVFSVMPATATTADFFEVRFDSTTLMNNDWIYVKFNQHVWGAGGVSLKPSDFIYTDGNGAGMSAIKSVVVHNPGDDYAILEMNAAAVAGDTADTLEADFGKIWTVSGGALPGKTPVSLVDNNGAGPTLYAYTGTGAGAVAQIGASNMMVEFMSTTLGAGGNALPTPIFSSAIFPPYIGPLNSSNFTYTNNGGGGVGQGISSIIHFNFGDSRVYLKMNLAVTGEIGTDSLDCNATAFDMWGNPCVATPPALIQADGGAPTLSTVETTEGVGTGEMVFIDPARNAPEPIFGNAGFSMPITAAELTYKDNNPGGATSLISVTHAVGNDYAIMNFDRFVASTDFSVDNISSTITPGVDLFNNSIIGSAVLADTIDPVIISYSPTDNATNVSIDSPLVVDFSEPINTGSLTGTISPDPGNWVNNWSNGDKRVSMTHDQYLYFTQYVITNGTVDDTAGNSMGGFNGWDFTTSKRSSGGSLYPTNYSLRINNDDVTTNSLNVSLDINAENADKMMISNYSNFIDSDWEDFDTGKLWTLLEGAGTKTVYMLFKNLNGNQSIVVSDTIEYAAADDATTSNVDDESDQAEPAETIMFPDGLTAGELVKVMNTSAVYLLGADGDRHAFPNEDVYMSWFDDFSSVKVVSNSTLAKIALGKNITMRPGTWLIKIKSLPNVYAVEPGGLIEWIESEDLAEDLYGSGWNIRIKDLSDAFWPDYKKNGSITDPVHPCGTLIRYAGENNVYYIDADAKRFISPSIFQANGFKESFIVDNVPSSFVYSAGDDLSISGMTAMMFAQ
ncbi:MAG: Ig-like domain-containing protein [Patescibacteria group bacterium]